MKGDNKNMKMLHEEMDADDSDDDYEVIFYFIFLINVVMYSDTNEVYKN